MPPSSRIVPHVGRSAEAGETPERHGGGVGISVYLQGRADEEVHSILTRELTEHAVRPQTSVATDEEDVGSCADIFLHANLTAEAVHTLHPAAFDRGYERRMRIERPVAADPAFEPEAPAVGRQNELDCGGIEADAMVEGGDLVAFIDAADHHHCH